MMLKSKPARNKGLGYAIPVFLVLGLLVVQGCASAPTRTGFIQEDIDLQPVPRDKSMLWWEHPDFSWQTYTRVMLDPVQVRIEPTRVGKNVKLEEVQDLANELHRKVAAELAPEFPVADQPDADVLRIRAAITDIDPANPALNAVTTLALFVPMDMGSVAIEAEFIDSATGRPMAALADRKSGTPLQIASGFKRYGHVHRAFERWAKDLKAALTNKNGKTSMLPNKEE